MKQFQYSVIIEDATSRITAETNDVDDAISALMEGISDGSNCLIVDGLTGEVYVNFVNGEKTWVTDEWALMINGWLIKEMWG